MFWPKSGGREGLIKAYVRSQVTLAFSSQHHLYRSLSVWTVTTVQMSFMLTVF